MKDNRSFLKKAADYANAAGLQINYFNPELGEILAKFYLSNRAPHELAIALSK